jgi:hypothetical protein
LRLGWSYEEIVGARVFLRQAELCGIKAQESKPLPGTTCRQGSSFICRPTHLNLLTHEATKVCQEQRRELDLMLAPKERERQAREEAEWGQGL